MAESFYIDMVNNDLTAVRNYEIPPPFGLEFYREGFEEHWIDIHKLADKYNHVDFDIFNNQFKDFRSELNTRQFYLTINNEFIGTSTAWNDLDDKYRGYGRIHWLAVIPAYQNRGLGLPPTLFNISFVCLSI